MMGWLLCLIGDHAWTSRALEGLQPTAEEQAPQPGDTSAETLRKFKSYATMYCKRCGKVYQP